MHQENLHLDNMKHLKFCFLPFIFVLSGCACWFEDEPYTPPQSTTQDYLTLLWENQMIDNASIMIAIRPTLTGGETSMSLYDSVVTGTVGLTGSPPSDLVDKYREIVSKSDAEAAKKIAADKKAIDAETNRLEAKIDEEKKKSAQLEEKNRLLEKQHEQDRKDDIYYLLTIAGTIIVGIGAAVAAFGSMLRGTIIGGFGASLAALPWLLDSTYFVPVVMSGLVIMFIEGLVLMWKRKRASKNCLTPENNLPK